MVNFITIFGNNLKNWKVLIVNIIVYDAGLNYYGVECGTSLRFWESKGWMRPIDLYEWFQWYFRYWKGRRSEDDIRQINRWKRIVSRFVDILNKLISENKDSKIIRKILLHWCYEMKKPSVM